MNTTDTPTESTAPADALASRKIHFIARQASDVLQTKIEDSSSKLLVAIAEHEEANQHSDTPKPFSIGFTIKIDWAGNKAVYALGFSTKYKDETSEELPDPDQPELPGIGDDESFDYPSIVDGKTVLSRKGGRK